MQTALVVQSSKLTHYTLMLVTRQTCKLSHAANAVNDLHSAFTLTPVLDLAQWAGCRTICKYCLYLCIVAFGIAIGNNILHCVSAVLTVVIPILRKQITTILEHTGIIYHVACAGFWPEGN